MPLKRSIPWLLLIIIAAVFIGKLWQQHTSLDNLPTQVNGPAVILFRGDNSPSCRAVHQLVEQAKTRFGNQINFVQTDWSADNPLIKKYQVRFLPAVVFIDYKDNEAGRIIGESPKVQQKLKHALTQLEQLLGP